MRRFALLGYLVRSAAALMLLYWGNRLISHSGLSPDDQVLGYLGLLALVIAFFAWNSSWASNLEDAADRDDLNDRLGRIESLLGRIADSVARDPLPGAAENEDGSNELAIVRDASEPTTAEARA